MFSEHRGKDKSRPTRDNMGVDVKGVVDRVNGAPPVVSLAEVERASIHVVGQHVRVTS